MHSSHPEGIVVQITTTPPRSRRISLLAAFLLALVAAFAGVGTQSSEATVGTNDYPSNLANAAQDSIIDPWNFYNRECTSFVAWRMNNDNGLAFTNNMGGGHWGNALEWWAN